MGRGHRLREPGQCGQSLHVSGCPVCGCHGAPVSLFHALPDDREVVPLARAVCGVPPQKPVGGPLIIAIDALGLKEINSGEWLREKWGDGTKKRRGWIKLHLCVNADTGEVLAHDLTTEQVGD